MIHIQKKTSSKNSVVVTVKTKELKKVIGTLPELSSTCEETAKALSEAAKEARSVKRLWGKPKSEQKRPTLVKLGLEIMHFPGLIPSIFLDELVHYKFIGISLLAAGLIQQKRRPTYAANVYESFQEVVQQLGKTR